MGKKLIIPGADFSEVAIEIPFSFVVPANQTITIDGVQYGSNVDSYYELDSVPRSGLNGDSALYNLKSVQIGANATIIVSRYFGNQRSLKRVTIRKPLIPTETVGWFFSCVALEEVIGLSNIDFSNVTSVYGMFYACEQLKSIDFTGVDLSNVTTFNVMFAGCYVLEQVKCDENNYSALLSCLQTDLNTKTWVVNDSHTLITAI